MPVRRGSSQSPSVAISAASERSGQAPGSSADMKAARALRFVAASLQGSPSNPPSLAWASSWARTRSPGGRSSRRSSTTSSPSFRRRRALTRPDASASTVSSVTRLAEKATLSAASSSGAARRMRSRAAPPPSSPTASQGSRARASAGSSQAPRPLASRNSPALPRALATRSGKACAKRRPSSGGASARVAELAALAHRSARDRASPARRERSRSNSCSR